MSNHKALINFIIVNIVILVSSLYIAFTYHNKILRKNKKKTQTLVEFVNRGQLPSLKNIFVGLVFGMVFGFMDNFGIWMGIDVLEKYMPGGVKMKAALGNTYSDMLGAIVGTSISIVAKDAVDYDNDDEPIWVSTFGIFLGCLLGIIFGRLITTRVS